MAYSEAGCIAGFEVCLQQWYAVEKSHLHGHLWASQTFPALWEGGSCSVSEGRRRPVALLFPSPFIELR